MGLSGDPRHYALPLGYYDVPTPCTGRERCCPNFALNAVFDLK